MEKPHSSLFLLLLASLLFTPLMGCANTATQHASVETLGNERTKPSATTRAGAYSPQARRQKRDLWDRIRSGYQLSAGQPHQFRNEMRHFLSLEHFFYNVGERADPFLYFIVDALQQRNMPTELALLPIVESAYKPHANSTSQAAGIWQFTPATGRLYDLDQNYWYDGRRDIYASTLAALNLLNDLHRQFSGDWLLAIAAYNGGPTLVRNAMEKNRREGLPTDFWHLELRDETQRYIPKLLAVREIIRNPARYRVELFSIPNHPKLAKVNISGQLDLKRAAELSRLDHDQLAWLNPGFKRGITAPQGAQYLLLPVKHARILRHNLSAPKPQQSVRRQQLHHTVNHNETLQQIAQLYDTDIFQLIALNDLASTRLQGGQRLLISNDAQPILHGLAPPAKIGTHNGRRFYRVRQSDTLWRIAYRFGTTPETLAEWNGLSLQSKLRVGQRLKIQLPHDSSKSLSQRGDGVFYQVREDDSLFTIARRFNIKIADIRRWNRLDYSQQPSPGQVLRLYPINPVKINES